MVAKKKSSLLWRAGPLCKGRQWEWGPYTMLGSAVYPLGGRLVTWLCDPDCLGECSSGICDEASCINGGTCAIIKADSYICLCPLGFRGRHCEDGETVGPGCVLMGVGGTFHQCPVSSVLYDVKGSRLHCWEGWESIRGPKF